jgi:hypothetical protein
METHPSYEIAKLNHLVRSIEPNEAQPTALEACSRGFMQIECEISRDWGYDTSIQVKNIRSRQ